jgi:NADH-quinone oxidoreductase subunit L
MIWVILAISLPWLGALVVWLIGDRRPRAQHWAAVTTALAGALASVGLAAFAAGRIPVRLPGSVLLGELTFVPDGLGVLLALIAAVIGCLTVVFSVDYMHGEQSLGRYYGLMLLFIGAMVGLVLTDSLLLLFVFWEITALCSYALISFHSDDARAVAAGIKALILTQVGGVGLLAGTLIIYAQSGSYSISRFLSQNQPLPQALLAVVAFGFLCAAMAKSAQIPFHSWLPDAMEAPTPVSALIHAATMVNAGVYLLARFYPAFAYVPGWTTAVIMVGVLSAVLAGAMALVADDLKRVLAYSTISQLGYMVYAVGSGALFASQFHLLSHAVFKALLFLSAGAVIHATGTRKLGELGGIGKAMPFVRNAFIIGALALAGVPLLNGFWSKELLLESGLEHGPLWAYGVMVIGGGLTTLYTVRVVWRVFFGQRGSTQPLAEAPALMRAALGALVVLCATTWLGGGQLSRNLATTLPQHAIEAISMFGLVTSLLAAPSTYLALVLTVLGLALWIWRNRLTALKHRLQPLGRVAAQDFGFDAVNQQASSFVRRSAAWLARTQTGSLNWNMAGLVGGLALILAVMVWRYL